MNTVNGLSGCAPATPPLRLRPGLSAAVDAELPEGDTLRLLLNRGEINAATVVAALRWRKDWMAYAEGYVDPTGRTGGGGDIHVGQLARVQAGARLRAVRDGIGFCGEVRLKAILVDGLSYAATAATLFGSAGGSTGRARIQAQFTIVLEALTERYETLRRIEEARRRAA